MKPKSFALISFVTLFTALFLNEPLYGFQVLVSFNGTDGSFPFAGLVLGSDGNFYGTTYNGGASAFGTAFKMTPAGVLTTLVSFNNTNGSSPQYAALVQGTNGNLYGTTPYDTIPYGGPGNGTVFSMTSAGLLTTLTVFNSTDGANPYAGLVQGTDGNFYGTTSNGGTNDNGTVFSMTSTGVLTTLVSFNGTNGSNPYAGLLQASDGNFYGTTLSGGNLNLNNGSGDGC
jgi:uncharacterized repeat protein (TIGR03803 family)